MQIWALFLASFETADDHDFIRISLTLGQDYHFYVAGLATGSLTVADATIRLLDANGVQKVGGQWGHILHGRCDRHVLVSMSTRPPGTQTGDYSLISTIDLGNINVPQSNGDDNATSTLAGERMLGRLGADVLTLSATGTDAFGQQGNDILKGNGSSNILDGGLGNDTLIGNAGIDFMFGDAGSDDIFGGTEGDFMHGGIGNDNLNGDAGNDFLFGEAGKDFQTGGAGRDNFAFRAVSESGAGANRDVILDFDQTQTTGDNIDLGGIDAKTHKAGNQAFKFIGTQAFHHKDGELRFQVDAAHNLTLVQGDVNGDGRADFEI